MIKKLLFAHRRRIGFTWRSEVPFGEDVSEGATAFDKESLRQYMVQHQPGAQMFRPDVRQAGRLISTVNTVDNQLMVGSKDQ